MSSRETFKAVFLVILITTGHAAPSQCCCSTIKGGSQNLKTTDYTFSFQYALTFLQSATSPQGFIKLIGRLPSSMTLPLWKHYSTFASEMNSFSSYPIDSDIQTTFPQYCLNFDELLNSTDDLSLSSVSKNGFSDLMGYPTLDFDLEYAQLEGNEEFFDYDKEQLNYFRELYRQYYLKNTKSAGNFFYVADNFTISITPRIYRLQNYYCKKGYSKWFRAKISEVASQSNDYSTLFTKLMEIVIPSTDGEGYQYFIRWLTMFMYSKLEDDRKLSSFVCPIGSSNCNILC